ncbi:uncharacterized protein LOC109200771 [Oreochromis niloticus]|uniref:uncharacterized protein LOC109200771 n=1 Tax=Oreochromis niloticus TaxID=8128 RepID=UPI0009049180|nr:uncharacterized protein LOC109200771 [Oreochromis niloticus]
MSLSSVRTPTLINSEDILPAISGCFDRLSGLQWGLIENGIWDSDVQVALADMITDVIQSVSASTIKTLLLGGQDQLNDASFQTSLSIAVTKISPILGNSLSTSFAAALNVTHEECDSAVELTQMVEEEISNKVNSGWVLVPENPESIYVTRKITNIKNLRCMVSHAFSYLKRYKGKLSCLCMKTLPSSFSSSVESLESKLSEMGTIKEISMDLMRWSTDREISKDDEDCHMMLHDEDDADKAAADIVNVLIANIQYPDTEDITLSEKCSSPKPAFDVDLVIKKVKDFFASCALIIKPDEVKQHFFRFAKKEFEKMNSELKDQVKKSKGYLTFHRQQANSAESESADSRKSVHMNPSEVPRKSPTLETTVKSSSPLKFRTVMPVMDKLFSKLTQAGHLDLTSKEIEMFSRELTDKVYDHVESTYPAPTMQMGKSLSESDMSKTSQGECNVPSAPKVPYVLVEDSVERFLQNLLFWLENETLTQTIINDKISGAVEDIVRVLTSSKEEVMIGPDAGETSDRLFISQSSPVTDLTNQPVCVSAEHPDLVSNTSENPEEERSETLVSLYAKLIANQFSTLLATRIAQKLHKNTRNLLDPGKLDLVINHLTELVLSEVRCTKSLEILKNNRVKLVKATAEGLIKEFGSPDKFFNVMISEESSFDGTILKHLAMNLSDQASVSHTEPTEGQSQPATSENPEEERSETLVSLYAKLIAHQFSTLLATRIAQKLHKNTRNLLDPGKLDLVINHLTDLILSEVRCTKSLEILKNNRVKLVKATAEGLIKEFGSPDKFFNVMISEDSSFDGTILKHLAMNLGDQASVSHTEPTEGQSQPATSENAEEERSETLVSLYAKLIAHQFSTLLATRIAQKLHKNTRNLLDPGKLDLVINHLTDLVLSEVRCTESLDFLHNNLLKLVKATAEGLIKEFGSPDKFFDVMISEDSSFDDTILKHLAINLGVFMNPPKKSKLARFFSAVLKAFKKPFSRCFKGSTDD